MALITCKNVRGKVLSEVYGCPYRGKSVRNNTKKANDLAQIRVPRGVFRQPTPEERFSAYKEERDREFNETWGKSGCGCFIAPAIIAIIIIIVVISMFSC